MASEKSVVKGVRLPKEIEEIITLIANYEDRTVSKVLSRFILIGLTRYIYSIMGNLANSVDTNKIDKKYLDFVDLLAAKIDSLKIDDLSNMLKKWVFERDIREKEDKTPE